MTKPGITLLIFVVGVVGVGWIIGATNLPGVWYAGLQKPSFNPPNSAFPVAWTLLYILIAVAGWRTYFQETSNIAWRLWRGQMALNFLWSPVVFRLHDLLFGLVIILSLLLLILFFIRVQWCNNRLAALLFIPYALWVAFAALLNLELYRLNSL
jgi:benzodiazapine receptor